MGTYDGPDFNDPVVRCEQCAKLTHRKFISYAAGCCHCGNKRFKNVRGMNEIEYYGLENGNLDIGLEKPYKIDPDFLAEFEQMSEQAG